MARSISSCLKDNPTVGVYDATTGAVIDSSLITLGSGSFISSLAVSGDKLFLTDSNHNTIGEYSVTGDVVNSALVSGLNGPTGIAIEVQVAPEPSTWALFGLGALLLFAVSCRRTSKRS